ncbi:MAG: LuxR C-terminal-related transcriptional regulator [Treponema sp.]|jgi:LuxR family maltose regulon positive regulatory protein|nr:LuxR C-terminal-related transcriptional regulator [Treponema sp.]
MIASVYGTVPFREGNQMYLERPRIHLLLEKAMQSPVITVTAGAGYGKTQAVYSFLQTREFLTAWIQFSERDNIQERFWENFTAAVGFIDPVSARRLGEHGFPGTGRRFDQYLTIPREHVDPDIRYVFVYDDFHLLKNTEVLHFMEQSVTSPFSNITSIIISRTTPNINIGVLDSRRIHTRVTEEDLRFTEEETAAYFQMQGIKVGRRTTARVCQDTEGWAFATHLAALFLKRLPASVLMMEDHYLPGMRSNIFRLLETEVLDIVSPGLRKFLIKLTLIDFLPRELLEAMNPKKDLITEMEEIGSFIRRDPYSNSYSVHHLFLECLTLRQGELDEQEKQEVYRVAAQWCINNERRIDALNYYEKAGDYQSIIAVIDMLPLIIPNHVALHLKELLGRVPESLCRENPMLEALRGKIHMSLGLFEECSERLRAHIRRLEVQDSVVRTPEEICHVLRDCYLYLGFVGLITSTDTGDYAYAQDIEKAALYSSRVAHVPRPPASVIMLGSYICRVREPDEEKIQPYLAALERSVPFGVRAFGGCMYGMDDLARGEYAYFRGDLSRANDLVRRALKKARERNQYEIENRSLFYLLRIGIHYGDCREIKEILDSIENQKKQKHYRNRFVHHDIIMGWFYVQIADTERLAPWLKNEFEEGEINDRGRGLEILVKAKYHLGEKKYSAALASLVDRGDTEGMLLFGRLETLAMEAVCRHSARETKETLTALQSSYRLARSSGITMPFIELGRYTRSLMDWALKEDIPGIDREWLAGLKREAAAYAKKLFVISGTFRERDLPGKERHMGQACASPQRLFTPRPLLSCREREVLACLSRGLTRTEIAETLSLSINTVKSVIRSVYNKLGAVNRSHAVQAAAEAGILKLDG